MTPALTRRGLVRAGAAALGTMVAPIAASAVPTSALDQDAALVALIDRHAEALTALNTLHAVADPLRARFEVDPPAAPEALSWEPSDLPRTSYGRGLSDPIADTGAREYGLRGVEWLRKAEPDARWSEEAEARRREIVEAHGAWMAARHAQATRIVLTAANDACDRASDLVCELEMEVLDHVPVTLDGFRVKARWIAASKQPEDWAEALLRTLCGEAAT